MRTDIVATIRPQRYPSELNMTGRDKIVIFVETQILQ